MSVASFGLAIVQHLGLFNTQNTSAKKYVDVDGIKALTRIALIHREVLVLFYFDDMPTAQMAEALDIAPGTAVTARLSARSSGLFIRRYRRSGAVLAMRPPELVRGAIEHEYYERTLRGNFMDGRKILDQLELTDKQVIPGYPQLMRPCDIDGHLVYHLTTFFEKGGIVTVFAFDKGVALNEASGWWGNVHWQVVTATPPTIGHQR